MLFSKALQMGDRAGLQAGQIELDSALKPCYCKAAECGFIVLLEYTKTSLKKTSAYVPNPVLLALMQVTHVMSCQGVELYIF